MVAESTRGMRGPLATLLSAVLISVAVLAGTSACAAGKAPTLKPGKVADRGIASWYGPKFHGRRTANGEVYDMEAMTAAHKTLPFGTVVEVYNRDNGRSVEVRINDRGPFIRGRVIDLSRAAAREIGLIGPGTARVEVVVVTAPGVPQGEGYTVQVGAFKDEARAQALTRELRGQFPDVRLLSGAEWHRVQVGRFKTERRAHKMRKKLRKSGFLAKVVPSG